MFTRNSIFICALAMVLLVACQSAPAPQATGVLVVTESGIQTGDEEETIPINNCGGPAPISVTSERQHTINIEAVLQVEGGVDVLKAAMSGYYGASASKSKSILLTARPDSYREFTLLWTIEDHGGAVARNGQVLANYHYLKTINVSVKSQRDVSCAQIPPTPTVTQPVPAPPIPADPTASAGPLLLRPHQAISVGTGVFERATFSDGMAPYDENWLHNNNHFNIQRLRPQEQPSGCDMAQYDADRLWVGAASQATLMINGSAVGTVTLISAQQTHGYIVMASVHVNDQVCISPVPAGGYHIVFGPDVYYHYDSYCYRGYC